MPLQAAGGARSVATMMPIGVPRAAAVPNENRGKWTSGTACTASASCGSVRPSTRNWETSSSTSKLYSIRGQILGKDIYLYINTEGGEVVPTMAILDTMKHIKSEVGCVAFGSAAAEGGMFPPARQLQPLGAFNTWARCCITPRRGARPGVRHHQQAAEREDPREDQRDGRGGRRGRASGVLVHDDIRHFRF